MFRITHLGAIAAILCLAPPCGALRPPPTAPKVTLSRSVTPLQFQDILEASPRELRLTAKARSMNGKRVRLIGFMADMEEPPTGGFFLCPLRVSCDEGGGGTADLPPDAVFVAVSSAKGYTISATKRPVMVTGILNTEKRFDSNGHPIALTIVLDKPDKAANLPSHVKNTR